MEDQLSRRERKKLETRQRLLEAALELFRAQGYETTTVEAIAAAADVAKSTFFNYFETKEAILPAIAEWRLEEMRETLAPESGAPASAVARIKLFLRLMADDPLNDRELAHHLATAMQERAQHHGATHPLVDLLTEQVTLAQCAGEVRDSLDPELVAGVFKALFFHHMMMWHCGYRTAPLVILLEEAVDLLMDGIAGPSWRQA